jgi:hypothetical protein
MNSTWTDQSIRARGSRFCSPRLLQVRQHHPVLLAVVGEQLPGDRRLGDERVEDTPRSSGWPRSGVARPDPFTRL